SPWQLLCQAWLSSARWLSIHPFELDTLARRLACPLELQGYELRAIEYCVSRFLRWVPGLVPLAQERSLHSPGTRELRVPHERPRTHCARARPIPPPSCAGLTRASICFAKTF